MEDLRNTLEAQTSPYLLQHADNPVHWQAWEPEALETARRLDKPILLSIGYSACHWCHVMAHESFEDRATAEVMNTLFVNIKVDREERPDLDKIYQRAHQLLTQRPGGWPLTMFLSADDLMPFFGGTYFPDQARHGMPAFTDVLHRVAEVYRSHRKELTQQNQSLAAAFASLRQTGAPQALDERLLVIARDQLIEQTDWRHGGFGSAPKFPHVNSVERLLRHWSASGGEDTQARESAVLALRKMALGGLQDQVGGGFCRYSTDEYWMIPHFEKMLYDNGQLLAVYAEAWSATGEPLFQRTAEQCVQWIIGEMQSPEGGFYSSLDADSEGEEGRFYVWRPEEVEALLEPEPYALFARRYGLDRPANFEGAWYPHVFVDWDTLEQEFDQPRAELEALDRATLTRLAQHRRGRVAPGRDDKVLTSWNALMARGLAVAGRRLGRADWVEAAERAVDFIRRVLWRDGQLLATYKDGRAHLPAYLDDHVFLMDALLELLQCRWRSEDLQFTLQLADHVLDHFSDRDDGGFYFTSDQHERLIDRPKPGADESTPAGNGVAAQVLARLGHLLGESRYLEAAEATLKAFSSVMTNMPYAHCSLLHALEESLRLPPVVVIRGAPQPMEQWMTELHETYAPGRLVLAIPADAEGLPPLLAQRTAPTQGVLAYVCEGPQCRAPVDRLEALHALLDEAPTSS